MTHDTNGTVVRLKQPLCYVMGLFYIVAGVPHFIFPKIYALVVPSQFPRPIILVYLSGLAEIVLGIGVLFPQTRRRSAWGLIGLLLTVFPANINMAIHATGIDLVPDWASSIYRLALWVRLPFQGILILWAWWYAQWPRTTSGSPETIE